MSDLHKAIQIALEAHKEQKDKVKNSNNNKTLNNKKEKKPIY